jgi:hypothetical protein
MEASHWMRDDELTSVVTGAGAATSHATTGGSLATWMLMCA